MDKDGVFYAELTDTEGNDPDGIGRTLADYGAGDWLVLQNEIN